MLDPTSREAKEIANEVLPLLSLVGKAQPWSRLERGSVVRQILGLAVRHGAPSVFFTISPDDVHQILTIRLSFASSANRGFPSFAAGPIDGPGFDAMLNAVKCGGKLHVGDDVHDFSEGRVQRSAANNPVATSLVYQRIVDAVLEVLIGLPNERHRKKTDDAFDCLEDLNADDTTKRAPGQRRSGIFGVPIAHVWVTETSGRKALHVHGALWTALAPALLATMASNDETMERLVDAIDTQVRGHVDWEVHLVHKARVALRVRAPRIAYESPPAQLSAQTRRRAAFGAVTLGDHTHTATCHKGPTGAIRCRGNFLRPHFVNRTRVVQLVDDSGEGEPKGVPADATVGDGWPEECGEGCPLHWWPSARDDSMRPWWIVKPQPLQQMPMIDDEAASYPRRPRRSRRPRHLRCPPRCRPSQTPRSRRQGRSRAVRARRRRQSTGQARRSPRACCTLRPRCSTLRHFRGGARRVAHVPLVHVPAGGTKLAAEPTQHARAAAAPRRAQQRRRRAHTCPRGT